MGKSQRDEVLDYIRKHGYITSKQVFNELEITQLGARIFGLKERGYNFENTTIYYKDKSGKQKHYDEYRLVE